MLFLAATSEFASGFYLAAACVPIACVIDGFDGRIARMIDGESRFGAEFDSLSDMFTFGVGPAFLAYFWGLHEIGLIGGLVAFVFLIAAMARLARFNLGAASGHGSDRYFEGLPAPMAGMGIAAVVGLQAGWFGQSSMSAPSAAWFAAFIALLALLMVSEVPFRSFKDLRLTPVNALFVGTVLSTVCVVSVAIDPMTGLGLAFFGYFFANLFGAIFLSMGVEEAEDEQSWTVLDEDWSSADDEEGRDLTI
jgi:CDP-diacylglycerol--serine O-phosphatidyltransferase